MNWKLGALLLAAMYCPPEGLGAQEPVPVQGLVIDEMGNGIEGAQLVFAGESGKADPRTDTRGRFQVNAASPVLLFRKVGFTSRLVRAEPNANLVVRMSRVVKKIGLCAAGDEVGRFGLLGATSFRIKPGSQLAAGRAVNPIDYWGRWFFIPSDGRQRLGHAGGVMWGFEFPSKQDVFSSSEYSEATYKAGRSTIFDTRGWTEEGAWRRIARFGESVTYRQATKQAASIFDAVMDDICLKAESR